MIVIAKTLQKRCNVIPGEIMTGKFGAVLLSGVASMCLHCPASAQSPASGPSSASAQSAAPPKAGDNEVAPPSDSATAARTGSSASQALDTVREVVVTATKRAQNTTQIPASITAIGSESLQQRRITEVRDLNAAVPGLQIAPNNADVSVTIRGVGHSLFSPAAENSVALHLDGIYLSRPAEAQGAFFDVSRIEVLRGPQGTLYGRNATGGAINIVSNEPTHDFSGYISGTVGNYARTDIEGVVSGPIAGDGLLGRFGGFYHRRGDGFGTNLATHSKVDDLDEYGFKGTIVAQPIDRLKITLRADDYHASDGYGLYHYGGTVRQPYPGAQTFTALLGGVPAANIRDTNYNQPNHRYGEFWGLSGVAKYDITDHLSLQSTTGYRHTDSRYRTDLDGTSISVFDPFLLSARSHQLSEEVQLNWRTDRLYAIVGAYYFQETTNSNLNIQNYLSQGIPALGIPPILPAPFGQFLQISRLNTNAEAVFANVDWEVTSRLTLTGGLRFSDETKDNRGFEIAFFPDFADFPATGYETVNASRSSNALTPKASVKFAVTPDVNVYASASRGFKSGEFIAGTNQYGKPETLWAYEAGIKGAFFDRALRGSLGAFYYDYSNLQVQRLQTPLTFLDNVKKSRIEGVEGEAAARLWAGFSIDGNFTYLDSKLGDFFTQNPNIPGNPVVNINGNQFAFAPKINLNAGIQKRFDFSRGTTGLLRFDVQHTSSTYLDIFNSNPANFRAPYTILNASYRLSFYNGKMSLLLWGKNLTNKTVIMNSSVTNAPNLIIPTAPGAPPYPTASNELVNLNDPQTFGATLRYEW